MDQQNAEKLLDGTFGHNFDINQFSKFIKELFNKFEISQVKINISKDNKEYRGYIDSYQILGTYKDESNKNIDVLAVQLIKESSRDRARTMQRNFIADYIEVKKKDAVLVAFYGDDPQDWRFSFVKMEYQLTNDGRVQKKLTPAKRHSFLVGKNEPNHTCKSRFLNLIMREDIDPSLNELEEAFGIENVTKEFFLKYKGLFDNLRDSLKNIIEKNQYVEKEFKEKNISPDDFSKKLLGQIVFLYFLQKKGWLGVERDNTGKFKEWGSGHKDFLTKLVNGEIIDYENNVNDNKNFFNDILEPLFYSALATPRENDYYEIFDYKCKIPFLNGGLFEPINNYNWQEIDILLDNQIFKDIINTFDEFNFTVKEDEPLDKEVAVDPEMLGKVFENLLEIPDRKSKGTYYTPREIVHYMCQQSLITYLATNSTIPSKDIETFIQNGDIAYIGKSENDEKCLPASIKDNLEKIDELLKKIKIVDPAVGSGAFPMGMMNEIVKARKTISLFLKKNVFCWDDVPGKDSGRLVDFLIQTFGVDWIENAKINKINNNKTIRIISEAFSHSVTINLEGNYAFLTLDDGRNDVFIVKKENGKENIYYAKIGNSYDLKRETIENCLYGVDIDSSAVDITKLRFWLSLVVDETNIKKIKPLPNLDHKIMCGNSLLGEFEGVKLFDEKLLEEIPKDESSRIEEIKKEMDELNQELGEIYTGKKKDNGRKDEIDKELKKLDRKKKEILTLVKEETQQYTFDQILQHRIKESHKKLMELRKLQKDFFNEQSKKNKKDLADKIDKIEWELVKETLKEEGNEAAMLKLQQYKKNKSKPFFLWKLYFSEVFQRENSGFDVVIANPPYLIVKEANTSAQLLKSYSNFYCADFKINLFALFIEKSIKICRKNGFISYIVPDSSLNLPAFKKLREFIIKENSLKNVSYYNEDVFENVSIGKSIILFIEKNKSSSSYIFRVFNNKTEYKDTTISYSNILKDENLKFTYNFSDKLENNLFYKLRDIKSTLDEYCDIYDGINPGSEFLKDSFISKNRINEFSRKIIDGKDFTKYSRIEWDGYYIFYNEEYVQKIRNELKKNNTSFTARIIKKINFFENKKIVTRQTADTIIGTIDNNNYYVKNSVHSTLIKNKYRDEIYIQYILAILNSELINWYYRKESSESGRLFPQVKIAGLRKLPIQEISKEKQNPFINLVDQILSITKDPDYFENPEKQARVKTFEKEIDQLVYKLYDLTPEEINIVDGFNRRD
ncbi:MAG: Eco57I restriction-modification methylase domain-containing protein [Candidatus Methanoperedenaceae archaeon]|nr:Eco57I restriction-modification methylase domain-containing protein [Candidatus Methanoperedenaceae archaeon]